MQIENGTYRARPTQATVNESKNGVLVLYLGVQLEDGTALTSYHALTTKDGALNTRTIDNLKAWSGWDGLDPFWFVDTDLTGMDIEVVLENEPFTGEDGQTRNTVKVKWVNPPGGGIPARENGDRRTLLTKYGSKFRANASGTPGARKVAPLKATVPPGAPKAPAAPKAPPRVSTMEDCWTAFCAERDKTHKGEAQGVREQAWFDAVDAIGKPQGKGQDAFTPEDWGRLVASIADDLPY